MAKGQKRTNRETRKPKQPKAEQAAPAKSFLEPALRTGAKRPTPRGDKT